MQFWLDNSSDRNTSGAKFSDAGLPSSGKLPPVPGYVGLQTVLDGLRPRLELPPSAPPVGKAATHQDAGAAERTKEVAAAEEPKPDPPEGPPKRNKVAVVNLQPFSDVPVSCIWGY
jgi:hypothetical protein